MAAKKTTTKRSQSTKDAAKEASQKAAESVSPAPASNPLSKGAVAKQEVPTIKICRKPNVMATVILDTLKENGERETIVIAPGPKNAVRLTVEQYNSRGIQTLLKSGGLVRLRR